MGKPAGYIFFLPYVTSNTFQAPFCKHWPLHLQPKAIGPLLSDLIARFRGDQACDVTGLGPVNLQVGGTTTAGTQLDRETKTLFSRHQPWKVENGRWGAVGDKNGVWVSPRPFLKQVRLTLLSAAFPNAYAPSILLSDEL